jgi:hypothetical protein
MLGLPVRKEAYQGVKKDRGVLYSIADPFLESDFKEAAVD